ncbi:MAG TPA: alanyl-tRNA editing protein [Anaerolineae bacterium]|nr:alanyl-tRNA editing protein [Anaerolineae bacterium]
MRTELLYHVDSYVREFEAKVVAVQGAQVALDRTSFFPGGGGQPADEGELIWDSGTVRVIKAKKEGAVVWHRLDADAPPPGSQVLGVLDWERRYALMRTHTALHILCGVIWRDYGAQVTGGNMEPAQARMDFEFETMRRELVDEIEAKINEEIAAGRPVREKLLPRDEAFQIPDLIRTKVNLLPPQISEVRIVEIVGLDLQADGGTHVANTSEVGTIRITDYKSKGRINKRLVIALG